MTPKTFVFLVWALLVVWALSVSAVVDQVIQGEQALIKSVLHKYGDPERMVRPSNATTVNFGIGLAAILDMDEETGTLTALYLAKMKWNDPRLRWSNSTRFKEVPGPVRIPITRVWRPDIRLWNSMAPRDSADVSILPLTYANGDVLWIPPMTYTSKCSLDNDADASQYAYNPRDFDKHADVWSCSLRFGSWVYNGWEINMELFDNLTAVDVSGGFYSPKLYGWKVESRDTWGARKEVNYYPCCTEPYHSLLFEMKLQRLSGGTAALTGNMNRMGPFIVSMITFASISLLL